MTFTCPLCKMEYLSPLADSAMHDRMAHHFKAFTSKKKEEDPKRKENKQKKND